MKLYNILSIACALGMASSACAMQDLPPEIQRHVMRHQHHQKDFRHAPLDHQREAQKEGLQQRVQRSKGNAYLNKHTEKHNFNKLGKRRNKFSGTALKK